VGVPKKPPGFFGYIPGCLNPAYEITQCYLPPGTGEHAPTFILAKQAGTRFTYLPQKDDRLSWPWCWLYNEMVYLSTDIIVVSTRWWTWPRVETTTFWS